MKILNVTDEFTTEALACSPARRIKSDQVITILDSMWELRTLLEDHRLEYNHYGPHSSLHYLTPSEFARKWREENAGVSS